MTEFLMSLCGSTFAPFKYMPSITLTFPPSTQVLFSLTHSPISHLRSETRTGFRLKIKKKRRRIKKFSSLKQMPYFHRLTTLKHKTGLSSMGGGALHPQKFEVAPMVICVPSPLINFFLCASKVVANHLSIPPPQSVPPPPHAGI